MANDEELCQYLVEQDNEQMDIECESDSSGTSNVTESVQNEPMECSSNSDAFSTVLQQVKSSAHQNSLIIRNIPLVIVCSVLSRISYRKMVYVMLTVNN